MTPIEQVRPTQPGNWVRRPDGRLKRGGQNKEQPQDREQPGRGDGRQPDRQPGTGDHHVDELA